MKDLIFSTAAAICIAIVAPMARGQMLQATDATQIVESQIPGQTNLVRWDMLLTHDGAEAFKKVAVEVKTESEIYQAYSGSATEFRQAMADAKNNSEVVISGTSMTFSRAFTDGSSMTLQGAPQMNYFTPRDGQGQASPWVEGFFQYKNSVVSHTTDGHLHLGLDISSGGGLRIMEGGRQTPIDAKPRMNFTGDLAAGDALAFLAGFSAPSKRMVYQLTVYEAFNLRPELGAPESIRSVAAGRPAAIAITSAPMPVNMPTDYTQAMIELQLSDKEFQRGGPATRPVDLSNPFPANANPMQVIFADVTAQKPVEVRVATGDWKEIGQCAVGESSNIDGVVYTITNPRAGRQGPPPGSKDIASPSFQLQMKTSGDPDAMVEISPVGADGTEGVSRQLNAGLIQINTGNTNFANMTRLWTFRGMSVDDVKYVRICARTWQTVTFDHYAAAPTIAPKLDFTDDELEAALKDKRPLRR